MCCLNPVKPAIFCLVKSLLAAEKIEVAGAAIRLPMEAQWENVPFSFCDKA